MTTRMQRSLAVLKEKGLKYQKVEYWNYYAKRRIDLFSIVDILVLDKGL